MKTKIKNLIKKALKEIQKEKNFSFEIPKFELEFPKEKKFGDLSSNVCLILSKNLKIDPLKIGNLISEKIASKIPKYLEKVEVAKPGFLNFFFSKDFLINELKKILKEKENYGKSKLGKGKTIIVDYSSPNIAKPFGIGHLRSTIIGQALYNIYQFLGYKCIGINHLGDWGTQFGKLIFAIKRWGKKKLDFSIEDLERLYVKFHQEAKKDPKLKEKGRFWFKKLAKGDKEAKKIWKKCVEISLREFERIYKLLDVKIDYAIGESFYEPMVKKIIEEAKKKKIALESKGALIIEFQKLPPAILLKSDGTTTYFARDLAAIKYRLRRWKPDLMIYEVGADQRLHFQQLFKAAELLGLKKVKFFHVAHGLYRTKTGKFSTRKGETVHLEDVLKEAILRAREIIEKTARDFKISEKEKEKISKIVGIGAIKYNDLKQHPSKDIIFSWEKVLNLKGNSAPYLQYTLVRAKSVLKKSKISKFEFKKEISISEIEKEILRDLFKFPEIVKEAAFNFSPNLICDFAFELAKKYNLFYDSLPILKAKPKEIRNFRLALNFAVFQTIKNSLKILGISIPERM